MPPSCRVRRNTFSSPYPLLLDGRQPAQVEDSQHQSAQETHASPQSLGPPPQRPSWPRGRSIRNTLFGGQTRPSDLDRETRRPVRPTKSLIAGHVNSRRSRLLPTTASIYSHSSDVAVHGSQLDVIIPGDSSLLGSALNRSASKQFSEEEHHEDDIVEHLEVIDPHVATVSHLSNAANSLLIPPISLYSRRPVIRLLASTPSSLDLAEKVDKQHVDELDRHVGHVLRKQKKIRRTLAGVWSFVKTPMGVITAIYGFLVVFWGAAIIFFLAGWVPTSSSDRKGFWVEVTSQIENALFTVTGIGLLPWRIVDTYRILLVWKMKRKSARLRRRAGLPELYDEDDLPDPQYDTNFVHVLTDDQQRELHHQQKEFAKSQTWYRPHGTETHRAFPITTAFLICLFIDGNSFFQAILCGCMWGLDRFQRPAWTTGTLIPFSFLCGITASVLIWRGGQKTKRTKAVEERLRAALEAEQQDAAPIMSARQTKYAVIDDTDTKSPREEIMVIPKAS
ncbi:hypothetical protein K439DRAFT_1378530 [Ramaria rubella]|nr:hypothetical protein K439DRAFT_1378530 [Ramaria rubella]